PGDLRGQRARDEPGQFASIFDSAVHNNSPHRGSDSRGGPGFAGADNPDGDVRARSGAFSVANRRLFSRRDGDVSDPADGVDVYDSDHLSERDHPGTISLAVQDQSDVSPDGGFSRTIDRRAYGGAEDLGRRRRRRPADARIQLVVFFQESG